MNVNAIRLRNFRGFSDTTLKLKPLTVLLGPNSSGKSSFGHALAALAHCQKLFAGTPRPSLTPDGDSEEWPIDLGHVADLRTKGRKGRVYIALETASGGVELGFGEVGVSDREKNSLALSYLSHPFSSALNDMISIQAGDKDASGLDFGLSRMNQGVWWDESTREQASVDLDGLLIRSMQHIVSHTSIPPAAAQERLRSLLSSFAYLRATRRRPSRAYEDKAGSWQGIGYSGEFTAAMLLERGSERTSFPQPPSIPATIDEAKARLDLGWNEWSGPFLDGVSVWLQQLGLATSVASQRSTDDKRRIQMRVTLPDQTPRDITEIGFGLSQVLPVLAAGLMQPPESLFVVDLPEAHLHPWPQARIADFFCSLALSGRYALVETHSEMFIHRLRLWAALNRTLLDTIAVYFIDEPEHGECRKPHSIELEPGKQVQWPVGFMGEAWDTEKRISIIREARGVRS